MTTSFNRSLPTVMTPEFLAPAGKRAHQLKPFELALIDCETGLSVDVANYTPHSSYELVFKTPSKGAQNAMFPDQWSTQLPIRSQPISLIDKSHLFDTAGNPQLPFVAYLGYDGISDCKSLNFPCGVNYSLSVTVRGESVRNTFGRNYVQQIPFTLPCCDDCASDVAAEKTVDAILDAIENAPFYAKDYFRAEKVLSCCPALPPFDKKYYKTYQLTVCDDGSSRALAAVQMQYQGMDVECIGRDNPYSTYEVCIPLPFEAADQTAVDNAKTALDAETIGTAAYNTALATWEAAVQTAITNATAANQPVAFKMTNVKPLVCDECPDCPTGFTKVEAGDKLIACFDSATSAGVDTLEQFTLDYYTDATTAQATIDTLVETAAATLPGYVANSAQIIEANCDKLTLQVCVTEGTVITEHGLADVSLTSIGKCTGSCQGSATVEWCPKDNKYKISRTLCLTVKDDDCGEDFLEEIIESLSDEADVETGSIVATGTNGCITSYKLTQCNNECLMDGCDTFGKDGAKFDSLPAFKGMIWKMCDCEGWTVDSNGCPLAPTEDLTNCRAGIKFTGAFTPREILECTFGIDDNIEREPLELEVSIITNDQDDDGGICDNLQVDWTVVQYGKYSDGRGEFALRKEVISRGYELYDYTNPKGELGNLIANRLGYEFTIQPGKFYNHITLWHNSNKNRVHGHTSHEREQITLYVDSDNVTFLEKLKDFFNKTLLNHGHTKLL